MKNNLKYFGFVFLLAFVFFTGGCGLETIYNVAAPTISGNPPTYNNMDDSLNYFSFNTNEDSADNMSIEMSGTAVYYKIYHNYPILNSFTASVDELNTSTTSTSDAAYRLIVSRGGYQELGVQDDDPKPLIKFAGSNRKITIRLTNSQENAIPERRAHIRINDDWDNIKVPRRVRTVGGERSFDWGRNESQDPPELNVKPVSGDADYDASGDFTTAGFYYVDAYAVNVGYDESYAQQYSRVLHLGTIRVDSTKRDN